MPKKKTAKSKAKATLPSVKLYRRVAATFLSLTVILLLVVLYLATVSATIRVETEERGVEAEFRARIASEPQANEDVPGMFFTEIIEETRLFEVEGDGEEIPAKAHGIVTITNETGTAQPLVATTRLLSENGTLFRIVEGVTVPANGSVEVEARADQEGKDGEVAAGRFTIPGLNVAKQEVIYATSDQPMVGGTETRRIVTEVDLDRAHADLLDELQEGLDLAWRKEAGGQLDGASITQQVTEKRSDTEPGTETGTFTISTIVEFTGLYYDRGLLGKIAEAKLREHVPDGQVLTTSNVEEMVVRVDQVDVASGAANVTVAIDGVAVLKTTADVLDKDNLVGLTGPEAEAFLEENDTIRNAEIDLFPFWVKRIPRLKDHIDIEIVEG